MELSRPRKSYFDMGHWIRSTTRAGRLTPIYIQEAVPSDVFHGNSEMLLRLAPLLAPIYDNIRVYVHFFFVPNRLLWDEWETFITGGRLGVEADPAEAPIPPHYRIDQLWGAGKTEKSSLADYLGCPIFADLAGDPADYENLTIDAMPFAAYQKIYMDYYRDRNFVTDEFLEFPLASGVLADFDYADIRTRSWEHDYFTSALPFAQRGAEVLMPIDAAVTYLDKTLVMKQGGVGNATPGGVTMSTDGLGTYFTDSEPEQLQVQNIDSISNITSTIGDFRTAFALQVWLERNAVGGSRYVESIQAHFGVKPQDERLQRAEYLGGGLINVQISEVVATAYSNDGTGTVPLANMAGHGISYGKTNGFHYFAPEHGFIIGIASIMSPPSYHQGLPRWFRRKTFLDYPWPSFANLGEQPVHTYELYASPANLTENVDSGETPLFGYQSRYADWKYMCSRNAGDFHDTLLFWTLTRQFADSPVLGQVFNEYDDEVQDRIFAVNGGADNFWMFINNKVGVKRALPYFGKPNTLGFGS